MQWSVSESARRVLRAVQQVIDVSIVGDANLECPAVFAALCSLIESPSAGLDLSAVRELFAFLARNDLIAKGFWSRKEEILSELVFAMGVDHIFSLEILGALCKSLGVKRWNDIKTLRIAQAVFVFSLDPREDIRKSALNAVVELSRATEGFRSQKLLMTLNDFVSREIGNILQQPESIAFLCRMLALCCPQLAYAQSIQNAVISCSELSAAKRDTICMGLCELLSSCLEATLESNERLVAAQKIVQQSLQAPLLRVDLSSTTGTALNVFKVKSTSSLLKSALVSQDTEMFAWCASSLMQNIVSNVEASDLIRVVLDTFASIDCVPSGFESAVSGIIKALVSCTSRELRMKHRKTFYVIKDMLTAMGPERYSFLKDCVSLLLQMIEPKNPEFEGNAQIPLAVCFSTFGADNVLDLSRNPESQPLLLDILKSQKNIQPFAAFEVLLQRCSTNAQFSSVWSTFPAFAGSIPEERIHSLCEMISLTIESRASCCAQHISRGLVELCSKFSEKSICNDLLSVLSNAILDNRDSPALCFYLAECLGSCALMSCSETIDVLFRSILKELLSSDTMEEFTKSYFEICCALTPCLSQKDAIWAYRTVAVQAQDITLDGGLQKKIFKLILVLLQHHYDCISENQSDLQTSVAEFLKDDRYIAGSGAKRLRLKCLMALLRKNPTDSDLALRVFESILFCVKESGEKTREAGIQVLTELTQLMGSDNTRVLVPLTAALTGSSHLKSSALICLSVVVKLVVNELSRTDLQTLVKMVFGLMMDPQETREVIQACFRFLGLFISSSSREIVRNLSQEILSVVLKIAEQVRNRYRRPIKVIVERLFRRCGEEFIMEEASKLNLDSPYLASIYKSVKKAKADKLKNSQRTSDDMDGDSEEDSHDDDELAMSNLHLVEDIDFLDERNVSQSDKTLSSGVVLGRKRSRDNDEDELKEAEDGRLIIPDPDKEEEQEENLDSDSDDGDEKSSPKINARDKTKPHLTFKQLQVKKKLRTANGSAQVEESGKMYKAKRAGGDVKIAGAPEPFAFIGFRQKFLKKGMQQRAVEQFESLTAKSSKNSKQFRRIKQRRRR